MLPSTYMNPINTERQHLKSMKIFNSLMHIDSCRQNLMDIPLSQSKSQNKLSFDQKLKIKKYYDFDYK